MNTKTFHQYKLIAHFRYPSWVHPNTAGEGWAKKECDISMTDDSYARFAWMLCEDYKQFRYNSNWNTLMDVIKFIKKLKWEDDGVGGVFYVEIFNFLDDIDIDNTYKYVVEFIEWYIEYDNKQNK